MSTKLKVLKIALENQNYDLAAHVLVYGLVKTKVEDKTATSGKKERRTARQSERS